MIPIKNKNDKPRFRIDNIYGANDFTKTYIGSQDYYIHRVYNTKELTFAVNKNQIRVCSKSIHIEGEIILIP